MTRPAETPKDRTVLVSVVSIAVGGVITATAWLGISVIKSDAGVVDVTLMYLALAVVELCGALVALDGVLRLWGALAPKHKH